MTRECPLCSAPVERIRWRTGDLVSGYSLRCPSCQNFTGEVHKDGNARTIVVSTNMTNVDLECFWESQVPGPVGLN